MCAHAAVGSIVLYQELWCVWIANTYYGRIKMLFQNELRLFFLLLVDDMCISCCKWAACTYYAVHARANDEKIMPWEFYLRLYNSRIKLSMSKPCKCKRTHPSRRRRWAREIKNYRGGLSNAKRIQAMKGRFKICWFVHFGSKMATAIYINWIVMAMFRK